MVNNAVRSDMRAQKKKTPEKGSSKFFKGLSPVFRWSILIAAILVLNFLLGKGFAQFVGGQIDTEVSASVWLGVAALFIYALLLAIPFVPGVEIGIALLIMQGSAIAPFVHAATVLGLLISYVTGWAFATTLPCKFLDTLGFHRACLFVDGMKEMTLPERLSYLETAAPRWIGRWVLRHRYLLLVLLINLPGNSLLGGGGGILLVAGLSRLFSFPTIIVSLILATAPVPLAVWFIGTEMLR